MFIAAKLRKKNEKAKLFDFFLYLCAKYY